MTRFPLRLFSSCTQKWIAVAFLFLIVFVIFPSFPKVRKFLSAPLVTHIDDARGDICYVLAGGGAIWERLDAAADLVQMGRVPQITLMEDNTRGQYCFKANTIWTKKQWMTDYLARRGISPEKISWIPQTVGTFGTLNEAKTVAKNLQKNVKALVVVSSAPHMRRSVLAFRSTLPSNVSVVPYAATLYENSYEMHHPIWIEYLKLLVYFVIA